MKRSLVITYILVCCMVIMFTPGYSSELKSLELECKLVVNRSAYEIGKSIPIQFQIKNTGAENIQLIISDKSYFNFDFEIRSLKNQIVNERPEFYLEREEYRSLDLPRKTVTLAPGEVYGIIIDINKFFDLSKIGEYVVVGQFFPVPNNLTRQKSFYKTTHIFIEITDNPLFEEIKQQESQIIEEIKSSIQTPWDTISFILDSRIKKDWDNYFLFMDFKELIMLDTIYNARYSNPNLSPREKDGVIEEYKKYLKSNPFPTESVVAYSIENTEVNNQKKIARLSVKVTTEISGIKADRKYFFSLYQKSGKWYLYHYTVNVGVYVQPTIR